MFTARNVSTGSSVPVEADQYEQLISLAQGGRLQRAAEAGRLFCVANQAAVATTAALATNWEGLSVANPTGSGKNIIMHQFSWGLSVVGPDEGVVGLMTSTDASMGVVIVPRSCFFGTGVSIAYCDNDNGTIGTPVLERVCGTYGTGAITTAMQYAPTVVNLDGGLILAPGRSVLTYTTTACTAAFLFSFLWEEVPE